MNFRTTIAFAWLLLLSSVAGADEKLDVVCTLGVLAEVAGEIGGDRVAVSKICTANQDPHLLRPRPTLMKLCRDADLYIEIGFDLEIWTDRLLQGSGNPRIQRGQPGYCLAAQGIRPLQVPAQVTRDLGDVHPQGNPHVWLSPLNLEIIAKNITAALVRVDPPAKADYELRFAKYLEALHAKLFGADLVAEIGAKKLVRETRRGRLFEFLEKRELSGRLGGWMGRARSVQGRTVISFHQTWAYFEECFGLEVAMQVESRPGIPPTPKHKALLVETIRARKIDTLLMAHFYGTNADEYLEKETGIVVKRVPIDVGDEAGVPTYDAMMARILDALAPVPDSATSKPAPQEPESEDEA